MNKRLLYVLITAIMLSFMIVGCSKEKTATFTGTIIEKGDSYVVVEPCVEEEIRKSADKISFGTGELVGTYYVGDLVEVTYTGEIMESYPAQVNVVSWRLIEAAMTVD